MGTFPAMGRLENAVAKYRAADAVIARAQEAAKARVAAAREAKNRARIELVEAMVDAAQSGMRQVEIVKITGYTRERVRQILRGAGVEADD